MKSISLFYKVIPTLYISNSKVLMGTLRDFSKMKQLVFYLGMIILPRS